jgi:hypothetical protein
MTNDKPSAAAERAEMTSTVDYEVAAMRAAYEALEHLELDPLRRVLEWLENRLISDAKKRQHEAERRKYADIEVPF